MYLGLDLGTTNVKALIVDEAGGAVADASCPVQLDPLDDGGVEQDLDEIWSATVKVLRAVANKVPAGAVRAIGVSSQGGAMQLVDGGRKPRGRVVSWLDQRGQPYADRLTDELGPAWLLARIRQRRAWLSIGQLLRVRAISPATLERPSGIGFVGDLIVERLCGRAAHDGTSAGLTLLYNPGLRQYETGLLDRLGVHTSQLPEILTAQQVAGGLLPEVARTLGLPTDIPVSPAIHDQYASALAAGAVQAGMVMVGTGTAWVLLAISDQLPQPVSDSALICHHVVDGLYGQIVSLVNGGSALSWVLELLGIAGGGSGQIERLLQAAPPGSDGVIFWPFLTPFGAAGLAAGTKGRLSGLQLSHRPAHVVRAVVEGLAFELKRHLALLNEAAEGPRQLVLTGGAASSDITPQILADVCELPLLCAGPNAGSALGAAIIARGLLEPKRSLGELSSEMSSAGRSIKPGKDVAIYADAFDHYLHALPTRANSTLPTL